MHIIILMIFVYAFNDICVSLYIYAVYGYRVIHHLKDFDDYYKVLVCFYLVFLHRLSVGLMVRACNKHSQIMARFLLKFEENAFRNNENALYLVLFYFMHELLFFYRQINDYYYY